MSASSNELAIPTTQQLCEQVIQNNGTDRGNGERIRLDADWQHADINGDPLRLRLIQQRGLGGAALYTLRVEHAIDYQQSIYCFDSLTSYLYQLHKRSDGSTLLHEWPSNVINHLLSSAPPKLR